MQVEGPLTVTEPGLGLAAAIDGAGVIQLLSAYIDPEVAAGRLIPLLEDWAPAPLDGYFLYYSSRRQMRPPLKAFIEFLRDAYRQETAQRRAAAPR